MRKAGRMREREERSKGGQKEGQTEEPNKGRTNNLTTNVKKNTS